MSLGLNCQNLWICSLSSGEELSEIFLICMTSPLKKHYLIQYLSKYTKTSSREALQNTLTRLFFEIFLDLAMEQARLIPTVRAD